MGKYISDYFTWLLPHNTTKTVQKLNAHKPIEIKFSLKNSFMVWEPYIVSTVPGRYETVPLELHST